MEQQLQQITDGFLREKSQVSENLSQRITELKEYLKLIDTISAKISELGIQHRKDISNLLDEKVSHQKHLDEINTAHAKEIDSHVSKMNEKKAHSDRLDTDISIKEGKINSLDNKINGLVVENTNLESNTESLRGQVSTLERAVKTLKLQESDTIANNDKLTKENESLVTLIEGRKKEASKLNDDIAILQSRLK